MASVLNLFGTIGNVTLPIFVFLTMLNVGLTRTLNDFLLYMTEWRFFLRMLVVNFIVAPMVMWLLLQLFSLAQPLEIGLIIFSMVAGAPFVIKLTQFSDHDIALDATLLVVLVLGTSVFVPIALPLVLSEIQIDGLQLFLTLARQLVLPIVLGLLLHRFFTEFVEMIQPWVGKLSNITLWVVVVGILVGEFNGLLAILGQGAVLASILFILTVTVLGYYLAGKNNQEHQQDLGALGTGQKNTAAGLIIASTNFAHLPEVLLIITVANILGIVLLVLIAKYLSTDHASVILNNE